MLRAEVGNALWNDSRVGVLAASDLPDRHREAMALIELFVDDAQLFPDVLTLAPGLGHPVYDAVYALTAKRHAATLLTFDHRLHDLCGRAAIESELYNAA